MNAEQQKAYDEVREIILDAVRRTAAGQPVTVLDLAGRGLTALPPEIGQLPALERLDLRVNKLTTLPPELARLTALTDLDVGHNRLACLPEVLWQLTSLRELHLYKNGLNKLPEALTRLEHLETLVVNANPLTTLPDWLPRLACLKVLWLGGGYGGCPLRHLPECLPHLPQLEVLWANDCELESLPDWLGELPALRELNLENNRLTALPASLHRLAQQGTLQTLFLHGNPALGLPEEVLGKGRQLSGKAPALPILDYFFNTLGQKGRELRELKVIVVGRGGAGKTTLIKRLRGTPRDPHEPETHGITICPLDFHCALGAERMVSTLQGAGAGAPDQPRVGAGPGATGGGPGGGETLSAGAAPGTLKGGHQTVEAAEGVPVKARVWDFGGQHVLHAMHQFFLTARSLYLIVLNEREELAERDARYWLQIIRGAAGDVPVVIALNKSRGRARDMDRRTLEEEYGPILAWVTTECEPDELSAGASDGIGELRAALESAAAGMDGVRARWAVKWDAIKNWLEGMAAPWLTYADYQKGCAEHGVPDAAEQEKLAGYLHDLGIALNYARDPRLRETSVLRPDWLANGIYALLRANHPLHPAPLAKDAILRAQDMGRIYRAAEALGMLEAKDYPEDRWGFLLRLMAAFQLSYPLDEKEREHLVPCLLPPTPPEGTEEPPGPDRTRLRYECEPIPGPLLPRFLVRTYALVKDHLSWLKGAVYAYAGATARVWLEEERRLSLTFAGPEEDRGELQTMLQGTLDELFSEYPNAVVKELWEVDGEFIPRPYLEKTGVLPAKKRIRPERGEA